MFNWIVSDTYFHNVRNDSFVATFLMFSDRGNFGRYTRIPSLSHNVEYWVWIICHCLPPYRTWLKVKSPKADWSSNTEYGMQNNTHSQYNISHLFCISLVSSVIWPIYISTTSSLVNSSSTIHFNTCVCWLEIRVQITQVVIGTLFYISHSNT